MQCFRRAAVREMRRAYDRPGLFRALPADIRFRDRRTDRCETRRPNAWRPFGQRNRLGLGRRRGQARLRRGQAQRAPAHASVGDRRPVHRRFRGADSRRHRRPRHAEAAMGIRAGRPADLSGRGAPAADDRRSWNFASRRRFEGCQAGRRRHCRGWRGDRPRRGDRIRHGRCRQCGDRRVNADWTRLLCGAGRQRPVRADRQQGGDFRLPRRATGSTRTSGTRAAPSTAGRRTGCGRPR